MAAIHNKILTQQYQPALREIILATTIFEVTGDISEQGHSTYSSPTLAHVYEVEGGQRYGTAYGAWDISEFWRELRS